MDRILAVLQARVSSTRFPGKVLKPILGEPMLWRQIERVKRSTIFDRLIVATSTELSDDSIERLCRDKQITCFRGNLNDVLDRFYQASAPYRPEHIVRLTGDCPLVDPNVIDQIISFHLQYAFDYSSNTIEPTYPDGLDVEVCRFECLESAWREALLPSHREHVTPFIYQQCDRFRIGSFKNPVDLSGLRWTVDEPSDFQFVTKIYEELYPWNPAFEMGDILALLEKNPALNTMSSRHDRNEGYAKSLADDALFLKKTR